MLPEHYIEWVSLQTKFGNQRKALKPGDEPKVCFTVCEGDEVLAVSTPSGKPDPPKTKPGQTEIGLSRPFTAKSLNETPQIS